MRKIFCTLALVLTVAFFYNPINVSACPQTEGCYATNENVVCGPKTGSLYSRHYCPWVNTFDHYCDIYSAGSSHKIYCAGCCAFLRNEVRTCEITHVHCGEDGLFNLCQY